MDYTDNHFNKFGKWYSFKLSYLDPIPTIYISFSGCFRMYFLISCTKIYENKCNHLDPIPTKPKIPRPPRPLPQQRTYFEFLHLTCNFSYILSNQNFKTFRQDEVNSVCLGEAGSLAVLPRRYAPMSLGSIPSPGAIGAFGFQSILAAAGFRRVLRFSLLHLKLDFLNKSVSKHHIEASLEFNAFALLGFAWFSAEFYK